MLIDQVRSDVPVVLFQITDQGLQLLNGSWERFPELTPNRWAGICRGGWRSLVPEEYHPEVEKLVALPHSEGYLVVEFPVYWQDTTRWLLVFAAAMALPEGGRKVVGLMQEITHERQGTYGHVPAAEYHPEEEAVEPQRQPMSPSEEFSSQDSVAELCHDLSGPLTSIMVNCEMLMEDDCPPPVRQRLEGIFSQAMHMNRQLRSHRRV